MARLRSINSDSILRKVEQGLKDHAKEFFEQGKGGEILKNHMVQAIDEKVYSQYDPVAYERRGENGGLKDKKKMYVNVTGNSSKSEFMHAQLGNFVRHNGYTTQLANGIERAYPTPLKKSILDFLYMLKDEGLVEPRWDTDTYDVPGTKGHPLHINKAIDVKVKADNNLRKELKRACITGVRKDKIDF